MKCEICGAVDADWTEDPYQADVNNTTVMRWICSECYHELLMDI